MKPVPAGVLLATLGMAAFGAFHWYYVAPVGAVFVEGGVWALITGAAVGWAYDRSMLGHGRRGVRWGVAFGACFAVTLVPYEVVGWVWGPFPQVASPGDVLPLLPLAFLSLPFAVVLAWLAGNRDGVVWPLVLAITLTHLIIGGSIAHFGGRGAMALLFVGFAAFYLLAGALLAGLVQSGLDHAGGNAEKSSGIPSSKS